MGRKKNPLLDLVALATGMRVAGRKKSTPLDQAREAVEQIRPLVGPLIDALTGPDPNERRIAAEKILISAETPFLVGSIVDLAIERLVCVEDADQGHVVDGLSRLGQPAVAHLVAHLERSKGEGARVRLVEALMAIGPNLSPLGAKNLMMTLTICVGIDPSKRVQDAWAQAIATLRRATTSNATRNESAAD